MRGPSQARPEQNPWKGPAASPWWHLDVFEHQPHSWGFAAQVGGVGQPSKNQAQGAADAVRLQAKG